MELFGTAVKVNPSCLAPTLFFSSMNDYFSCLLFLSGRFWKAYSRSGRKTHTCAYRFCFKPLQYSKFTIGQIILFCMKDMFILYYVWLSKKIIPKINVHIFINLLLKVAWLFRLRGKNLMSQKDLLNTGLSQTFSL